ncbi:hypothetical protein RclHR1_01570017 [Rhizophagus clarus]|uniref:Uncharacterized protein n=1 Tax=Rhizophagus clarus TaxID=94130 RepID=A0A2Z6QHG1_9GLOM|nr:hypothetical protein RclHR1_01570017 [Rhizophagus clarus]GES80906.1 hypothetical protein RCL_e3412_RclHR1_01570017 [Rhizophagus clarus]
MTCFFDNITRNYWKICQSGKAQRNHQKAEKIFTHLSRKNKKASDASHVRTYAISPDPSADFQRTGIPTHSTNPERHHLHAQHPTTCTPDLPMWPNVGSNYLHGNSWITYINDDFTSPPALYNYCRSYLPC